VAGYQWVAARKDVGLVGHVTGQGGCCCGNRSVRRRSIISCVASLFRVPVTVGGAKLGSTLRVKFTVTTKGSTNQTTLAGYPNPGCGAVKRLTGGVEV